MTRIVPLMVLFACLAAGSEVHRSEIFDTSGMPAKATTFLEQQIFEMIASHPKGDLADAARVQGKLGKYYADKGDQTRSLAAFRLAAAAQAAESTANRPAEVTAAIEPAQSEPSQPAGKGGLSGNYFGYEGRLLHTWEFSGSGSFLHTWIAAGSGTSVRNSERGSFVLSGETLELRVRSSAGGYITPGAGGRTAIIGGGSETASEIRRIRCIKDETGLVLDGVKLKPRSW